ncbi:MAG: hypothetical protein WCY62_02835 [Clostridia bacterium]
MKLVTIKTKDIHLNKKAIMEKLRIDEGDTEEFDEIFDKCMSVAVPKYLFDKKEITEFFEDSVNVEGDVIKSRIATGNLKNCGYVYPYLCTCGREVYDYANTIDDTFLRYWADMIMQEMVFVAIKFMHEDVIKEYGIRKSASINPGSTVDWHISGQTALFSMLKGMVSETGIELTPSYLMLPQKSTSGIIYESDEDYVNCQYCKRVKCPSRRKEYSGYLEEKQINA